MMLKLQGFGIKKDYLITLPFMSINLFLLAKSFTPFLLHVAKALIEGLKSK